MAYSPSLADIPEEEYQPSLGDIPNESMPVQANAAQKNSIGSMIPGDWNVISGLMSLMSRNPEQRNLIANLPQVATGSQPTTSQKVEQSVGQTLPALMTGGGELPFISKELSAVPVIGKFLSGAAGRVLPQAAAGAAINPNPLEGAKDFGGIQAGIEGATLPFRGLGTIAELFNPIEHANSQAEAIHNAYQEAVQKQKAAYEPVMEKYGNNTITLQPEKYLGFDQKQIKYFTPQVKKLYQDFINEPNLNNLHSLQSQMGFDAAKTATSGGKINTSQTLTMARNSLTDKISKYLSKDPEALDSYNLGKEITRDQVIPYRANDTLEGVSEGLINNISPKSLSNAIQKGIQKKGFKNPETGKIVPTIPEGHPLRQNLSSLNTRMNIGNAFQYGVPVAAAALGGEMIHPGLGALGGAGAGAAIAKYLEPGMLNLIQNPSIRSLLNNYARTGVQGAARIGLGYNTNQK